MDKNRNSLNEKEFNLTSSPEGKPRRIYTKGTGIKIVGRHNDGQLRLNLGEFYREHSAFCYTSAAAYRQIYEEFSIKHGRRIKKIPKELFERINKEEFGNVFDIVPWDIVAKMYVMGIAAEKDRMVIDCRSQFYFNKVYCGGAAVGSFVRRVLEDGDKKILANSRFYGEYLHLPLYFNKFLSPVHLTAKIYCGNGENRAVKHICITTHEMTELMFRSSTRRDEEVIFEKPLSNGRYRAIFSMNLKTFNSFLNDFHLYN